jgi:hypothetical protein
MQPILYSNVFNKLANPTFPMKITPQPNLCKPDPDESLIDVLGQLRISTPYAVDSPPMATSDPHPFACKEKLSRSAKILNTNAKQGKIELHRKLKVVAA